jgi:GNAT superfamily N-acetyltransferase
MGSAKRSDIDVRLSADDIDWTALKTDLVADDFDNGRSPDELRSSFENSFAVATAWDRGRCVGTARMLSDGICNAYLVDVWTASSHRRRGLATRMIDALLTTVPGQHVALFTQDKIELYKKLGFAEEVVGMSRVVGTWLRRDGHGTGPPSELPPAP